MGRLSDANDANNKVVATAEGLTSDAFHRLLDLAITGRGKLQGARTIANNQLRQRNDQEDAIRWLSNQHIALAGGQGFATNWGGFLLSLVTIPANMAAAAFVQARAVAAIAHLRGYELNDPRVRTAILMVMLGPRGSAALIASGDLPSFRGRRRHRPGLRPAARLPRLPGAPGALDEPSRRQAPGGVPGQEGSAGRRRSRSGRGRLVHALHRPVRPGAVRLPPPRATGYVIIVED